MTRLMDQLRRRHLFFVDSRTNAATLAERSAHRAGLPFAPMAPQPPQCPA